MLSGTLPFGSKTLLHLPIVHGFSYGCTQEAPAPPPRGTPEPSV